jgi:hypothetical protein
MKKVSISERKGGLAGLDGAGRNVQEIEEAKTRPSGRTTRWRC